MALNKFILKDKKYLLTFSGGPDSVYGLVNIIDYFINNLNCSMSYIREHLFLVYINYHDSEYVDLEERIVNYYVDLFKLKCFHFDDFECANTDKNFENEARQYRYKLFVKLAKENKIDYVVVNEHLNDLVETYYLQKKRKNYVSYFSLNESVFFDGINIIRPFLGVTKKQIYDFLHTNDYDYYEDITNTKNRERNNLRIKLNKTIFTNEKCLKDVLKDIDDDNKQLRRMKSMVDKAFCFSKKNIFKFDYSNLDDQTKTEYIKRVLYLAIDSLKNEYSYIVIREKYKTIINELYYFVIGGKNTYCLTNDILCVCYNKKYAMIPIIEFEKIFSFSLDKDNDYMIDNDFIYCDFSKLKQKYKLTTETAKITDVYSFNDEKEIYMNSKLKCKTVKEFFKDHKIPHPFNIIYPIFLNSENKCIYIPKIEDLFTENFYCRYLENYKELFDVID